MRVVKRFTINRDVATYDYDQGLDHFVKRGVPVRGIKSMDELKAALNGHLQLVRENSVVAREIRLFLGAHGVRFLAQSRSRS